MAVGIVCEYNPFHNGHKYQIQRAKELTGAPVVCVMSGDFVQRGEPAQATPAERARLAISGGADLVLENPYPFSCAGAELFARSAIKILSQVPTVDTVCFGAEDDDEKMFFSLAEILLHKDTSDQIKRIIKADKTIGYAQARDIYIKEKYGEKYACFLRKPNNILGIEYTKAILFLGTDMKILPVLRVGAGHDEKTVVGDYCSATYLRENMSRENLKKFCPDDVANACFKKLDYEKFYSALCTQLFLLDTGCDIAETDRGFLHRLIKCAVMSKSYDDFFEKAKSKHITDAKLRRILIYTLCKTERKHLSDGVRYTRLLAANQEGNGIMKMCKETAFPILSKISDVKKYDKKVADSLSHALRAQKIFEKFEADF